MDFYLDLMVLEVFDLEEEDFFLIKDLEDLEEVVYLVFFLEDFLDFFFLVVFYLVYFLDFEVFLIREVWEEVDYYLEEEVYFYLVEEVEECKWDLEEDFLEEDGLDFKLLLF